MKHEASYDTSKISVTKESRVQHERGEEEMAVMGTQEKKTPAGRV